MNLEEGYLILAKLSKAFGTSIPLLEFPRIRNPRHRGRYFHWQKLIHIYIERDWINTLLHEYVHHLHPDRGHDRRFANLLYKVVVFYYDGHVHKYSWDEEYRSLQKYPLRMLQYAAKLERVEKRLTEMGE